MSLQKFKLLATHCSTVAESPTRSPVIHLRRRKTLRLLLSRSSDRWRSPEIQNNIDEPTGSDGTRSVSVKRDKIRSRRKLRELFVSSPPVDKSGRLGGGDDAGKEMERALSVNGVNNNGGIGEELTARRMGFNGSVRPMLSGTFRCRLLRRAWRPVLVTIPEQ
ncbi:hypothetical protein EUTSA_v10019248mg [Eutrema salsugineum]|uniref:Uncharacterized protein n=1 Tax=Eutrema salsugineum TaxID=72664 RepID=V4JTS9_EUTSA|nr:uncharacterized protein LOC18008968 [Eutrema salsugineum]ESQ28735.1 hypothetical protein EUTSA_v10019248mg [Eutrema salsugineum]